MDSSLSGVNAGAGEGTQHLEQPPLLGWQPSAPVDPKDVPQKTPISLLQECCTRKGATPQYELMATEGQVHEPTFVYRVTVNEMQATGQGKSKKVAKHLAAKGVLDKIVQAGQHVEWQIPGLTPVDALKYLDSLLPEQTTATARPTNAVVPLTNNDNGENGTDNPIGQLQNRCMRNHWPPPEYELVGEEGLPHERTFKVAVKLGKFEEIGEARNKKTAKRLAAEKMLTFLASMPAQGYDADEDAALAERFASAMETFGHKIRPLTALDLQRIEAFFGTLKRQPGQSLRALRGRSLSELMTPADCDRVLRKIAEEQQFPLTFVPMELRTDGQFQCLVQLSTMPVAVCYGMGNSEKEAQYSAAHNALHYLKIMTKNGTATPKD